VQLTEIVEVFFRVGGVPAALDVARGRRGTQFDPSLVDLMVRDAGRLFEGLDEATSWGRTARSRRPTVRRAGLLHDLGRMGVSNHIWEKPGPLSEPDGAAADAVLSAAGHRIRRRSLNPAGLTPREVEVLTLLARGLSNREIARRLFIADKTVGNHVEHIYSKIGVSTRAGASLFAMQHGLVVAIPSVPGK
jgi:DNA-binding CsgD family transcriptional regulator